MNIKEVYTIDSLHFHKGTVDKNIFKKAETEIGFNINNEKSNVNYRNFEFFHKITVMLSFVKDVNDKF